MLLHYHSLFCENVERHLADDVQRCHSLRRKPHRHVTPRRRRVDHATEGGQVSEAKSSIVGIDEVFDKLVAEVKQRI